MATRLNNQSLGPNAAGEGLRLPPHSIEAEQAVLGGLMLDSAAWDQVADRVNTPKIFTATTTGSFSRPSPASSSATSPATR